MPKAQKTTTHQPTGDYGNAGPLDPSETDRRAAGTSSAGTTTAGLETITTAATATGTTTTTAGAEGLSAEFVAEARRSLEQERSSYLRQAEELKAAADSLALDHEPGDVQFDEEGGEGGTANVDRELDLLLSAQARAAVEEIDRAIAKIDAGTYGRCERCAKPIPEARLEALPHAALCVSCKSGGLSSRR